MHQCIFGWDSSKSCLEDFLEIPSLSDKSVHEFYICDLNWNCCSKGWCSLQGGWGHPPRGGAGQRNTNGQLVGEPQSGQHRILVKIPILIYPGYLTTSYNVFDFVECACSDIETRTIWHFQLEAFFYWIFLQFTKIKVWCKYSYLDIPRKTDKCLAKVCLSNSQSMEKWNWSWKTKSKQKSSECFQNFELPIYQCTAWESAPVENILLHPTL